MSALVSHCSKLLSVYDKIEKNDSISHYEKSVVLFGGKELTLIIDKNVSSILRSRGITEVWKDVCYQLNDTNEKLFYARIIVKNCGLDDFDSIVQFIHTTGVKIVLHGQNISNQFDEFPTPRTIPETAEFKGLSLVGVDGEPDSTFNSKDRKVRINVVNNLILHNLINYFTVDIDKINNTNPLFLKNMREGLDAQPPRLTCTEYPKVV